MSECFNMDLAYMRFSTDDRTFVIAVVSTMSDLTLINGECEDRHGPKAEDRRLLFNTFTRKMSGSLDST